MKAKAGRNRKAGPRHPCGKLKRASGPDKGCDGVVRRRTMYRAANGDDTQTFDAAGRAYSAGLLDNIWRDATVLRDQARELRALYLPEYGVGNHKDTLLRFIASHGSGNGSEHRARALDAKRAMLRSEGFGVVSAVDSLAINGATDSGPPWLDRLIEGKARFDDKWRLALAIRGLVALC